MKMCLSIVQAVMTAMSGLGAVIVLFAGLYVFVWREKVKISESQISQAQKATSDAEAEITKRDKEIEKIKLDSHTVHKENVELNKQIIQNEKNIQEAAKRALESEVTQLKNKISDLEEIVRSKEERIQSLQRDLLRSTFAKEKEFLTLEIDRQTKEKAAVHEAVTKLIGRQSFISAVITNIDLLSGNNLDEIEAAMKSSLSAVDINLGPTVRQALRAAVTEAAHAETQAQNKHQQQQIAYMKKRLVDIAADEKEERLRLARYFDDKRENPNGPQG